ncbi:hypothetical protein D1872_338810 [compost metagenome]
MATVALSVTVALKWTRRLGPASAVFNPSVPNKAGVDDAAIEMEFAVEAFWESWLSTKKFGIGFLPPF